MNIQIAAATQNLLGEGPLWDHRQKCLWWVDIKQSQLFRLRPAKQSYDSWELPKAASVISLLRQETKLLLTCVGGFYEFDPETGISESIGPFERHIESNRPNDGKCDPLGNLWVGSMDDAEEEKSGSLYRISADLEPKPVLTGLGIPNTLAWSPDHKHFYFADSTQQTIWKFDVNLETGTLSNQQVFASLKGTDIYPDGSTIDQEGYLWNAQWNGWRVVRYAPDGTIDKILKMPVACPTSCMFGGENLSTLYVTSARKGQTDEELAQQPNAGSLFAISVNTTGLKETIF
ncbi:SMP-30/gluconolactonase/LRE family protein [Curvivirga sp.]|uniref:SMP-30/gluconolactonase/LRE family protein n=1 Tax=Curvivirga sp. TaxID=2856848 RepID=UPI003B5B7CFA